MSICECCENPGAARCDSDGVDLCDRCWDELQEATIIEDGVSTLMAPERNAL